MIRVEEALEQILSTFAPLGPEKVGILDALGRVLGEDVTAPRDIPPRDNSAMDGYALRWQNTRGASPKTPVLLGVTEDIPAGDIPRFKVGAGQAARIMTGAPIPAGANAVLRMEDTKKAGRKVRIMAEAGKGQDIRRAGEDVQAGDLVIRRGTVVRPAEIGMLAALGRSFVSVHQRPVVAILATGNELIDIDGPTSPWSIVSSNSYSLTAQVLECGAIPLQLGIARDNRADLIAKLQAASRADVIISSGGVSVGDYDLVKDIMKEVGNRMQFWRVAMRPGRPLAFGAIQGIPVFGLPGNPVSSMISFEQFVRPSLLKMMGHRDLFRTPVRAILEEEVTKSPGARLFLRAVVRRDKDRFTVATTGDQGSGILKSMVRANGLIVLPEEATGARKGDEVTVQLLDRSLLQTPSPSYL